MSAMPSAAAKPAENYDVVVVGAGFAGMYMLHRLRQQGMTAIPVAASRTVIARTIMLPQCLLPGTTTVGRASSALISPSVVRRPGSSTIP